MAVILSRPQCVKQTVLKLLLQDMETMSNPVRWGFLTLLSDKLLYIYYVYLNVIHSQYIGMVKFAVKMLMMGNFIESPYFCIHLNIWKPCVNICAVHIFSSHIRRLLRTST